jgi:hypothetical protein
MEFTGTTRGVIGRQTRRLGRLSLGSVKAARVHLVRRIRPLRAAQRPKDLTRADFRIDIGRCPGPAGGSGGAAPRIFTIRVRLLLQGRAFPKPSTNPRLETLVFGGLGHECLFRIGVLYREYQRKVYVATLKMAHRCPDAGCLP